ncbi:hypothetical protein MtrunA17_Chr7g0218281 [Medicago truncatula]|uniref:Uncharacterized protein n=1 Tax=Medicago truncatula TaxID=3880 RepID=G7L370_MEDTR|nr:hypothetical protein MTR_7g012085 [Medicago truncatula]RHN44335.1 hypothetical protein MtrunA17_Chr7g0218281 [Medicago truncatula]
MLRVELVTGCELKMPAKDETRKVMGQIKGSGIVFRNQLPYLLPKMFPNGCYEVHII